MKTGEKSKVGISILNSKTERKNHGDRSRIITSNRVTPKLNFISNESEKKGLIDRNIFRLKSMKNESNQIITFNNVINDQLESMSERKGIEETQNRNSPRKFRVGLKKMDSIELTRGLDESKKQSESPSKLFRDPAKILSSQLMKKKFNFVLHTPLIQVQPPIKTPQLKFKHSKSIGKLVVKSNFENESLMRILNIKNSLPDYYIPDLQKDILEVGPGLHVSKSEDRHLFIKHLAQCFKSLKPTQNIKKIENDSSISLPRKSKRELPQITSLKRR